MTAFAGIVTFDNAPYDIHTEEQIGRAIAAPAQARAYARRAPGALFVQRVFAPASSGASAAAPLAGSDNRLLFAAHSRLDNRAELGAALAIAPAELARTLDSLLILRMHQRWGEAGIARCLGAFAFALWDADARRLMLGRDCLGNRVVFFHRGNGFAAFATTLGALLAMPRVPREIDEIALADLMAVNLMEPRRTYYRGVERVPSRTLVMIDRDATAHRQYWTPDIGAQPVYRREQDYIERARELFDQAVAVTVVDTPNVAISTSGGLDSSAVAATVARLGRASRITCYTLVPPEGARIDVGPIKYMDERDKVQALARMHPALDVRFIVPEKLHARDQDVARYFARINVPVLGPAVFGPFGHLHDAVVAEGHRQLLVGFHGNFGLTWQGRYSLLALLRSGQWATFTRELLAVSRGDGGLKRGLLYGVLYPSLSLQARRLLYKLAGRNPDSVAHFSALNPAFIAESDLARRWRSQGFDPWFGEQGWNAAQFRSYRLFDHNQPARDISAMSGEWLGFDFRDPHADRRLLEFALAVPEPMYRRNGVARSFARAVFADRLPPEILNERRRGAQTVTWFRDLDARREDIATELERLEASPLARRLIDLPRLKRLMSEWPKDEHAAEKRRADYRLALNRGIHVGRFIRWVEGGNA